MDVATRSPFWKERFLENNVDIKGENILEEIKKLPILTKTEVLENVEGIKTNLPDERLTEIKTSGTTGAGLIFPQTISMENKQWAVWWRNKNNLVYN